MHELKCINYSSTDSEQLFSRSTDTQLLEDEIELPEGGVELRAWVSGAPHLVPTESGPTVCMTSSINHSSPHAP